MCDNIELVTIDSEEQANESTECIPVTHRKIVTVNEFKEYFINVPAFVFIVLLFFNPSNQILHPILKEIKKRKSQIIRVLICGTSIDNLANNSMYIRFVSELLLTYKIKSTIAHFLDRECMKQCNLGKIELGMALYHQRTRIVEQFHTNDKLKACHILLIPLNATAKDLQTAQQRLKNICYRLYGNEYRFVIHTLFDYIPEDEKNPGKRSYTAYLEERYKGDICHTIMGLSFIRMYVVGNEPYIPNKWSQELAAAELDINQDHVLKYVDRCSFIKNESVAIQSTGDLVSIFPRAWQIQRAAVKTLNEVSDDIYFQDILPRIHGCLENREMIINNELHRGSLVNSEDITRLSNEIRSIRQAQHGPEEQQDAGDIRSQIVV